MSGFHPEFYFVLKGKLREKGFEYQTKAMDYSQLNLVCGKF